MALPIKQQLTYWGIATLIFLAILWFLGPVLAPFLVGGAIAYFLDPVADRLQRMGLSRVVATTLISLTVLLVGVLLVLAVDLIVFGALIVIVITGTRDGRMRPAVLGSVGMGLVRNPMIVSIVLGLAWSGLRLPLPGPVNEFLIILGGAATPGALFAIGASLAGKSAERPYVTGWLSACKLIAHPAAVAVAALLVFNVAPYSAAVMIAAASLPVAGNVYMLAQHYGVAPQRVSTSILISTMMAALTVSLVIGWVQHIY